MENLYLQAKGDHQQGQTENLYLQVKEEAPQLDQTVSLWNQVILVQEELQLDQMENLYLQVKEDPQLDQMVNLWHQVILVQEGQVPNKMRPPEKHLKQL